MNKITRAKIYFWMSMFLIYPAFRYHKHSKTINDAVDVLVSIQNHIVSLLKNFNKGFQANFNLITSSLNDEEKNRFEETLKKQVKSIENLDEFEIAKLIDQFVFYVSRNKKIARKPQILKLLSNINDFKNRKEILTETYKSIYIDVTNKNKRYPWKNLIVIREFENFNYDKFS